jgi:hypothetical protein
VDADNVVDKKIKHYHDAVTRLLVYGDHRYESDERCGDTAHRNGQWASTQLQVELVTGRYQNDCLNTNASN